MNFVIALFLIAPVVAFEKIIWRNRLLPDRYPTWTTKCQEESAHDCRKFQECCKKEGEKECAEKGGMLEYNVCNYYGSHRYDKGNGICLCVEKYVVVDHTAECGPSEEREECVDFSDCCRAADCGECKQYVSGMLEKTNCVKIRGEFNFPEAFCRCMANTTNPKLREGMTVPPKDCRNNTLAPKGSRKSTVGTGPSRKKPDATGIAGNKTKGNGATWTGDSQTTEIAGANSSVPSDGKGLIPISTTSIGQKRSAGFKLMVILAVILSTY